MSSVETSRQNVYDEFGELIKDVVDNDPIENNDRVYNIPRCPRLIVQFFSIPIKTLIDTGSQITAMSEECYEYLSKHNNFSQLPVTNLSLFTAIGKHSTRIKKQIIYNMQIGKEIYQSCFLIVPKLSNPVILGNDWLQKNNVILNYPDSAMIINGNRVNNSLIFFDKINKHQSSVLEGNKDIIYIQGINEKNLLNENNKINVNQGDNFDYAIHAHMMEIFQSEKDFDNFNKNKDKCQNCIFNHQTQNVFVGNKI